MNAHKRKKQPREVRRKLLECAASISAEQGSAGVTIQAVADAAGVTKGGLLHHFPDKKSLIEAVFQSLLARFDEEIDALINQDPIAYGCFTRAYINVSLRYIAAGQADPWQALSMSALTEPELKIRWSNWLQEKLRQHQATDSDPALQIVRYAADGIWLAHMLGFRQPCDHAALLDRLGQMIEEPS